MTLIYGYKPLSGNVVITNEVGSAQDVMAVVKPKASAKVVNLFTATAPKAVELELAA